MRKTFVRPHHLGMLHQEILAQVSSLRPIRLPDGTDQAILVITGDGQTVTIDVPDDLARADLDTIEQVIQAHDALGAHKRERIAQIKREAYLLLQPTDWFVVRQQETGAPIPQAVLDYRAAVRQAADRAEQEIAALTDVEAVRAYTVQWPERPEGVL